MDGAHDDRAGGALTLRDDNRRDAALASTDGLVVVTDPTGLAAETLRGLRTRVMAQHVQAGRRALAICTPSSSSGCSFIASNLATAVAQVGVKTVIVDCNLRVPGLHHVFGLGEPAVGLAEYLDDPDMPLDRVIASDVLADLAVIPAGQVPANPQELLAGPRFRGLVNQLMREFDLTIFDTPPANTCSDAQRVATVAGYALIVARQDHSYVSDVATLAKLLRADGAVVVGSVLNDY